MFWDISEVQADKRVQRINHRDPGAALKIAASMNCFISDPKPGLRAILCIGSDRSTGDALGPLVGSRLASLGLARTIVMGTLAEPVHALNLEDKIQALDQKGCNPIIAVDACLGRLETIGLIEIGAGPLLPGAGVKKKLPPVGQAYLSGIVNIGGMMEQMVLQSTRLYTVVTMADVIARGLHLFLTPSRGAARDDRFHRTFIPRPGSAPKF